MNLVLELLKSIVFGVVQGITEWLPVSSTGHMILLNEFMTLNSTPEFWNTFLVVIQLGSILAVVCLFFHKLNPFAPSKSAIEKKATFTLWFKVLIAVIPAGVVGLLFDNAIETLNTPIVVASTLIIYGVLFIILESRNRTPKVHNFGEMTYKMALFIGAFQMLALIPGTSRSGATILGAVLLGCSRYVASEFSFFLAIPVMFGASFLKLVKVGFAFSGAEWAVLLTGAAVAFVVSLFAIKFLLAYVKKHDFKPFGYYRIALGILVLAYFFLVK